MYCFMVFQSPPWSADTHHGNADELEKEAVAHMPRSRTDPFVKYVNGPT